MKMCMLLLASLFIVISPLNSDYTNMMKWLTENKAVISPKLSLISENEKLRTRLDKTENRIKDGSEQINEMIKS